MVTKKATNKKVVTKKATVEERILGGKDTVKVVQEYKYNDKDVKYKVTVVKTGNVISATGANIETYIGCFNNSARIQLIEGANKVKCFDRSGFIAEYIIEVV